MSKLRILFRHKKERSELNITPAQISQLGWNTTPGVQTDG
jgi:hypothetical protein